MPLTILFLFGVVPDVSVAPMAGNVVAGLGVHPGTAGAVPDPSWPLIWYGFEFAPAKLPIVPGMVSGDGTFKLNWFITTSYCNIRRLPSGNTDSDVRRSTWLALANWGSSKFAGEPTSRCPATSKMGLVKSKKLLPSTSVFEDCSVMPVIRTHFHCGPFSPTTVVAAPAGA